MKCTCTIIKCETESNAHVHKIQKVSLDDYIAAACIAAAGMLLCRPQVSAAVDHQTNCSG